MLLMMWVRSGFFVDEFDVVIVVVFVVIVLCFFGIVVDDG